jgi:hypothetical protein
MIDRQTKDRQTNRDRRQTQIPKTCFSKARIAFQIEPAARMKRDSESALEGDAKRQMLDQGQYSSSGVISCCWIFGPSMFSLLVMRRFALQPCVGQYAFACPQKISSANISPDYCAIHAQIPELDVRAYSRRHFFAHEEMMRV